MGTFTARSLLIWLVSVSLAQAQHTLTGELPRPAGAAPPQELVAVAGATGRTGRLIIGQLRADGRFAVRALARDPDKARQEIGSDYDWVAADVTAPDSLAAALRGATYVVSAIGATARSGPGGPEFVDFGGVRNLVDAARAAGAHQFVLISSIGAGGKGGLTRWFLNLVAGDVLTWKARGEDYLRASGLAYTIVRPGGLRDAPGGRTGLRLAQGDEEFGDITRADTAAVVIATLDNAAALHKTFEVIADDDAPVDAWRGQFGSLLPDDREAPGR